MTLQNARYHACIEALRPTSPLFKQLRHFSLSLNSFVSSLSASNIFLSRITFFNSNIILLLWFSKGIGLAKTQHFLTLFSHRISPQDLMELVEYYRNRNWSQLEETDSILTTSIKSRLSSSILSSSISSGKIALTENDKRQIMQYLQVRDNEKDKLKEIQKGNNVRDQINQNFVETITTHC
jgi:hypothetical protein